MQTLKSENLTTNYVNENAKTLLGSQAAWEIPTYEVFFLQFLIYLLEFSDR